VQAFSFDLWGVAPDHFKITFRSEYFETLRKERARLLAHSGKSELGSWHTAPTLDDGGAVAAARAPAVAHAQAAAARRILGAESARSGKSEEDAQMGGAASIGELGQPQKRGTSRGRAQADSKGVRPAGRDRGTKNLLHLQLSTEICWGRAQAGTEEG
jgi:hypothetical protein